MRTAFDASRVGDGRHSDGSVAGRKKKAASHCQQHVGHQWKSKMAGRKSAAADSI
jgi:hypothetical protein